MRLLKSIFLLSASVISILLSALWNFIVLVISWIDGGEETVDTDDDSPLPYNYRTGDIDSVKRWDGIYDPE